MEKTFRFIIYILLAVCLTGCASLLRFSAKADKTAGVSSLPPYSGPKARIAIADFDVKGAKTTVEIGSGLLKMLTEALIDTKRFSMTEGEALPAQGQGASVAGKNKSAELIISVVVTEFEPKASGGSGGLGGGGGIGSGSLGGLLGGSVNKARMVLDIRITDVSLSKVIASTQVQGQASEITGGIMSGFFGKHRMTGGLSAYANTPMEKAIRICIIEAVRYISQNIPESYYKY